MKKVAIFDIDGTIFRSSLLIEVTEAMILQGIFPKSLRAMYEKDYNNWLDRKGSYDKYIGAVVKAFEQNIKGVFEADFARISKQVVDFHENRVYRYTRNLVKKLKKEKYFLLAISHSPRELVYQFCTAWGFDKVYGRVYEVGRDKTFTGKTSYLELISDKAKILKRAVKKENLTLKDSVGVGDSEGDISFLSQVENPICFNPSRKLYSHAQKSNWQVVVERKNVVYSLNN